MRRFIRHIIDMAAGALILGAGLFYLGARDRAAGRLMDYAKEHILDRDNLYEQSRDLSKEAVSYEELYSIIMGYRDYPISIDGSVIPPDGTDYTAYLLLVKSGSYKKSYLYDINHNIVQINYTYNNPL